LDGSLIGVGDAGGTGPMVVKHGLAGQVRGFAGDLGLVAWFHHQNKVCGLSQGRGELLCGMSVKA